MVVKTGTLRPPGFEPGSVEEASQVSDSKRVVIAAAAARDLALEGCKAGVPIDGRVTVTGSISPDDRERIYQYMAAFLLEDAPDEMASLAELSVSGSAGAAESRVDSVITLLKDESRKKANAKPRIEERAIGAGEPFQLALAFKDGGQRARFAAHLEKVAPGLHVTFSVVSAGSTTLEIGLQGIDKASPMRYLSNGLNLRRVLNLDAGDLRSAASGGAGSALIPYHSGTKFDVNEYPSIIFADFDGTLVNAPKKGESAERQNLGNSPAREGILAYLRAGGVLVINSGNDVERVVERIAPYLPVELLGNVLVAGAGGNALVRLVPGGFREVEGYREACASRVEFPRDVEDMLYLGDDKRAKGNDRKGFEFVGKERSICFATDPHLEEEAKTFLEQRNVILGGPRAAGVFFEKVVASSDDDLDTLSRTSSPDDLGTSGSSSTVSGRYSPAFSVGSIASMVSEARQVRGIEMFSESEKLTRTINMLRVLAEKDPELQGRLSEQLFEQMRRKAEKDPLSWSQIQRFAAAHEELLEVLEEPLKGLSPSQRGDLILRATQLGLVDLSKSDSMRLKHHLLFEREIADEIVGKLRSSPFSRLEEKFLPAFNDTIRVERAADGRIQVFSDEARGGGGSGGLAFDALLIMGNNDLRQVDNAVAFYLESTKELRRECRGNPVELARRLPKIYISGFGGHGTSAGKIFAHTEAETMREHIEAKVGILPAEQREAIMSRIEIEPDATNSGQNVQFLERKFGDPKAVDAPKRFIISGTPAAVKRQVLSFARQTKYPFESVDAVPMDHAAYLRTYYPESHEKDRVIHYMCRLREVVSFLDYSVGTDYVYPTTIDPTKLQRAVQTLGETYHYLTRKSVLEEYITPAERRELRAVLRKGASSDEGLEFLKGLRAREAGLFTEDYNLVMQAKLGEELPEAEVLAAKARISATLKPMAEYFRNAFAALEERYMERVDSSKTLREQRRELLHTHASGRSLLAALGLEEYSGSKRRVEHPVSPDSLEGLVDEHVEEDGSGSD